MFSGTSVSSTKKTDRHDITEILLNVALNTINQNKPLQITMYVLVYFLKKSQDILIMNAIKCHESNLKFS